MSSISDSAYEANGLLWSLLLWGGFIFRLMALLLLVLAIIGLFLPATRHTYRQVVKELAVGLLITSTLLAGVYAAEIWFGLTAANRFEAITFRTVHFSGYSGIFYGVLYFAVLLPQLFWWERFRRRLWVIVTIALITTAGAWFERVTIAITVMNQDFLPRSWDDHWSFWF